MFKPSTRTRSPAFPSVRSRQAPGFAETQFLHAEDDEDYSGFAPTQMFEDVPPARAAMAAPVSHGPGAVPSEENAMPASWVTSRWVEAQEAKAHEAAHQARVVIAAQRRGDRRTPAGAVVHAGWMRRMQMAVQRVLPLDLHSVLPLFICVSLTMALISAVLPLFDKP